MIALRYLYYFLISNILLSYYFNIIFLVKSRAEPGVCVSHAVSSGLLGEAGTSKSSHLSNIILIFSPFAQLALQEQQKRWRNIIFLEKKDMHNLKRPATFYYSILKRAENNILRYFVN